MKHIKHYFKGFTLVELIIVITILAILASIAFISFQNYSWDARDANRVSTLKNIETWLELFTLKTSIFPTPDEVKTYTWWLDWKSQLNQWIIWESVAKIISMNTVPLDPKEKIPYVYSTFWKNNKYYQIWIDAENQEISFLPQVYAKSKTSIVKWNYKFDPSLPSLILVENEALTNSWIFSPEVCFVLDWGKNSLNECNEIKSEMNLKDYDNTLVWYWDMESLTWNLLKDLSGNENHWTIIWNQNIWIETTLKGWGTHIMTWWIVINNFPEIKSDELTIHLIVKTIHKYWDISSENQIKWYTWRTYDSIHWSFINQWDCSISCDIWNSWYLWLRDEIYFENYTWWTRNNEEWNIIFYTITSSWWTTQTIWKYLSWSLMNYNKPIMWDDSWHQIHLIKKDNSIKIYLDGLLLVEKNNYIWKILTSNLPIYIWASWHSINNNISVGVYDDISIYNRALTPEEILQQAKIAWF